MEKTISNSYDEVLHIVTERNDLTEDQKFLQAKELFPELSEDKSDHYYDEHLTESKIDMYAYHRTRGCSSSDAAHCIELSAKLMRDALLGKGVSFRLFFKLVSEELFCLAGIKAKHLSKIEESEDSLRFLQTVFPNEYSKEAINVNTVVNNIIAGDAEKEMRKRGIPIPNIALEDLKPDE